MATARKPWSSREEYKKAKELEEARKAGTAPPEQDEEGRDINPHIPMYIAQAPWYLNTGKPGLKHQRKHNFKEEKEQKYDGIEAWYARGQFKDEMPVTAYRKGACTNCGAMTHKLKDCVERPRRLPAKWTGKDIQPDEVIVEVNLDYEGKRDRWNGFDPRMYAQVMDQYQEADEARRKKLAEDQKKFMTEPDAAHKRYPHGTEDKAEVPPESLVDDDKSIEAAEFGDADEGKDSERFSKRDPRTRTTVRNLRIREDRAKYLHNLDPDSAFYDPKSRSMRENPYEGKNPDEVTFAGDNFMRSTGDSQTFYEMQHYAWEACHETPSIPNLFAEPSQAAVLFDNLKRRKRELENEVKDKLTLEYGGEEHTKVPTKTLLMGQTEVYQEYAPDGSLVRGTETIPKSKYEEDVYTHNHTTVWGSYYDKSTGKWGYRCCKLCDRQASCLKVPLVAVSEDAVAILKARIMEQAKAVAGLNVEDVKEGEGGLGGGEKCFSNGGGGGSGGKKVKKYDKLKKKKDSTSSEEVSDSSSSEESDSEDKKKKRKKTNSKIKSHGRKSQKKSDPSTDVQQQHVAPKRKFSALTEDIQEPTMEEINEYKLKQIRWDDPMRTMDK